jgi:hypothetical protein
VASDRKGYRMSTKKAPGRGVVWAVVAAAVLATAACQPLAGNCRNSTSPHGTVATHCG